MLPGIDGFHWTPGHIIFLCLFFAVAITIFTTVAIAAARTARDFKTHRAVDLCCHADFDQLPVSDRRCRHEMAGRVKSRTCDNAFDCRHCQKYPEFAVLPTTGMARDLGLNFPADRLYHRGHTWVKTEEDGTVTIGLDDLAEHMVGVPDSAELPAPGAELDVNETAWRLKKSGREISVRAPIEGIVLSTGGPQLGWYLKMRPRRNPDDPLTMRHLLRGAEVQGWISRELERLQIQMRKPNTAPSLADGGVLLPDLMDAVPDADWSTVLADTFLEV